MHFVGVLLMACLLLTFLWRINAMVLEVLNTDLVRQHFANLTVTLEHVLTAWPCSFHLVVSSLALRQPCCPLPSRFASRHLRALVQVRPKTKAIVDASAFVSEPFILHSFFVPSFGCSWKLWTLWHHKKIGEDHIHGFAIMFEHWLLRLTIYIKKYTPGNICQEKC